MSSSFAGASTRGLDCLDREIEYRLGKGTNHGAFDEDFRAPGAREAVPGADYSKGNGYQAPHDDYAADETHSLVESDMSDYEGDIGPEEFHKRVEHRLKALSAEVRCPECRESLGKPSEFFHPKGQPRMCPNCNVILKEQDGRVTSTGKYPKLSSGTEKADNPDLNDQSATRESRGK